MAQKLRPNVVRFNTVQGKPKRARAHDSAIRSLRERKFKFREVFVKCFGRQLKRREIASPHRYVEFPCSCGAWRVNSLKRRHLRPE